MDGAASPRSDSALELQSPRLTRLLTLSRPPYTNLTVSLSDVGAPDGHPVVVYLGLGGVRYLTALYDDLAVLLNLRLVCVDRFGLGRSDDVPADRRAFLPWASVVEEVADQLGLARFSILAHSAGCPYAMATCVRLPDRVFGSVNLLAPWVGLEVDGGYKWLKYVPTGVIKTATAAEWRMQGWMLGKPLAPELLRACHAESQGGTADLLAVTRKSHEWGFAYTDVRLPVKVWYGDRDEKINEKSVRWLERELDDCTLIIKKGEGHNLLSSTRVIVEVLESIAAEVASVAVAAAAEAAEAAAIARTQRERERRLEQALEQALSLAVQEDEQALSQAQEDRHATRTHEPAPPSPAHARPERDPPRRRGMHRGSEPGSVRADGWI